ncbi:MAG: Asp-tRNA(Asn)/Glu-tRNA(Gln) amidotransferase GatCAB subunit C [Desulfobulbus propionicus]|nr:MAG: Asp-tRNA(Asn)/Glu-tRNA(Gln) amidotransferase GatCAB subunit C [Desulfobulbus propionicus]
MKITRQEVQHVARLARLELGAEETEKITRQLDIILQYVAKLDEIDTRDVPVTTHTQQVTNAFREDRVHPSLDRDKALRNGGEQNGTTFVVPRVI